MNQIALRTVALVALLLSFSTPAWGQTTYWMGRKQAAEHKVYFDVKVPEFFGKWIAEASPQGKNVQAEGKNWELHQLTFTWHNGGTSNPKGQGNLQINSLPGEDGNKWRGIEAAAWGDPFRNALYALAPTGEWTTAKDVMFVKTSGTTAPTLVIPLPPVYWMARNQGQGKMLFDVQVPEFFGTWIAEASPQGKNLQTGGKNWELHQLTFTWTNGNPAFNPKGRGYLQINSLPGEDDKKWRGVPAANWGDPFRNALYALAPNGDWTTAKDVCFVKTASNTNPNLTVTFAYPDAYYVAADPRATDEGQINQNGPHRGPQVVAIPDGNTLYVASASGNQIFIDSYQFRAPTATRLAKLPSLGLLGGFTRDDQGNFYVLTGVRENEGKEFRWIPGTNAPAPRQNILRLLKVDGSGKVVWAKDLHTPEFLFSNDWATYQPIWVGSSRLNFVNLPTGGGVVFGNLSRAAHHGGQGSATFAVRPDGEVLLKLKLNTGHCYEVHTLVDDRTNPRSFVVLEKNDHQPTLSLRRMAAPTAPLVFQGSFTYEAAVGDKMRIVYSRGTDHPDYNQTLTNAGGVAKGLDGGYLVLFSSHTMPSNNGSGFRTVPYNLAAVHVARDYDTPKKNIEGWIDQIPGKNYEQIIKYTYDPNIVNTATAPEAKGVMWLTNFQGQGKFDSVERPKLVGLDEETFIALFELHNFENKVGTYAQTFATKLGLRKLADGKVVVAMDSGLNLKELTAKPRLHWNDDPVLWNGAATWATIDLTNLYIHRVDASLNYTVQAVAPQ